MKEEVMKKVNQIGKAGQIVVTVAKVFLLLVFVIVAAIIVTVALLPEDSAAVTMSHKAVVEVDYKNLGKFDNLWDNKNLETPLEIDGVSYDVTSLEQSDSKVKAVAESNSYTIDLKDIVWVMSLALLCIICIYAVLHFLGKLCRAFKCCDTPFTQEIVDVMHKLAVSLIPMTVLMSIGESAMDTFMTGEVEIMVGIDITVVILVILVFLLAAVFRYGTMLQQESDETI